MHALRSTRTLLAGLGLAAFSIGLAPGSASAALPLPGTKQTFRLFARAVSFLNVNRVYCGMNVIGEACVDSAGRGTTQGGFWPRGSNDNYTFNSGLQIAGVIQGAKSSANPWGGDTTGGWFFDGAGGRQQTEGVAGSAPAGCVASATIFQSFNPADVACWPNDAYVPSGDFVADVYAAPLQGLVAASQGDVHWLSWEGNPALNRVRLHPLGILVDYRFLAWNYPAGAQDVIFLVSTFYNITSANAADYAQHRPGIRSVLIAAGQKFQALNNATFGITLPVGGYTIGAAYAAIAADHDVGNENINFNGVILPFAMGYTYDGSFGSGKAGWTFDPAIFAPPFFKGVGFVGLKFLRGPQGTSTNPKGSIQLMSTFCNGNCGGTGGHSDPATTIQNYRQMAGKPAPTDGQCNIPGDPAVNHVCFMLLGSAGTDTRMSESTDSMTLKPGEGKVIVVAYIFAPPVAIPGFVPSATQYDPGNVTWTNHPDSMIAHNGANKVDSISGFLKYIGPQRDPDGSEHKPVPLDFQVVPGSLLSKALVAQAVFDVHFLQEFAPDAPQFFLIPGDKQVTILWKPSPTETTGDPFFQVVGFPTKVVNGVTIPNPLYDPNYRQFDVEGYRIYRGRSDTPSALKLLVQFDYAGTKFKDFTGTVVNGNCAPELGILTDCPVAFPTPANPVPPGTAFTRFATYNIGPQTADIGALSAGAPLVLFDQTSGKRIALVGGLTSMTLVADTAVSGGGQGFPPLSDTGVPFIFVDKTGSCAICGVSNGITYFYSVTAFDVNSPGHGPTSLESAKVTKQVIPQAPASNFISSGNLVVTGPNGRTGLLTDNVVPTLDPATGKFSKKFPPSNGLTVQLAAFVPQVLKGGNVTVGLDSIVLATASNGFGGTETATVWMSVVNGTAKTVFSLPIAYPDADVGDYTSTTTIPGLAVDSALSARFGGGSGFAIPANVTIHSTGGYYTGIMGRGCINSAGGFAGTLTRPCAYNGPRWFIGDSETMANPNSDNGDAFNDGSLPLTFSNSGQLAGVSKIYRPVEYMTTATSWRGYAGAMSMFIGDADYRMYWGTGGKVDSVIDLTHNTVVPFDPGIRSSWGFLNASAVPAAGTYDGRAELTFTDVSCISTFKAQAALQGIIGCSAPAVSLSQTAIPGPIVICSTGTSYSCNQTAAPEPNPGFLLYIKGHIFMMELSAGLPASGTQWTMRDYTGAIRGGAGRAGDFGPYVFTPSITRPFTALGANFQFSVTATNQVSVATAANVAAVHTVPDPYYVTSALDLAVNTKDIQFVNVPVSATIRIYTSSGVLIRVLQNTSTTFGGIVHWDVRNRTNQFVSSGVYFYNVESGGVNHTGRMTIVNYASTVQ